MSNRETYVPGPAAGAEVQKDGDTWTLVLVRELRHPPAMVWQALTDPAQLSQWAPFDADRSLAAVGPVKLTTIGAPAPYATTETQVKRADAPQALEYSWGGRRHALGAGAAGRQRHAAHALVEHQSRVDLGGRGGLAHLLRRAGSAARGRAAGTHGRPRAHEVRRLAAIERRLREAVRRRDPGPSRSRNAKEEHHGIDTAEAGLRRRPYQPRPGPSSTGSSPRSSACR